MKGKLDKIKTVLSNEGDGLKKNNADQLLNWIKTQYSITQDILEILGCVKDHSIQHKDRAHRVKGGFSNYFLRLNLLERTLKDNKEIEHSNIDILDEIRKDLINDINSFYETDTFWVENTKHQLAEVVDKLQEFKGDPNSNDFLDRIGTQYDIWNIKKKVNESLPIPDNTQCNDWIHDFNRSVKGYIGCLNYLEEDIKNKVIGQEIQKRYQRLKISKTDIIASINSLNDISFDIKKKSLVQELSPYVKSKCPNTKIEVEANAYIDCNNRVFKGIINELSENYRKYGTDGKTSVTIENNMLTISLYNKKKEKNPEDFSSKIGLKIFDKYMKELGGLFEHNYDSSDCITIIRLPIYIEKQQ